MYKDPCVICGSVRRRSLLIQTNFGKAHSYHRGVTAERMKPPKTKTNKSKVETDK